MGIIKNYECIKIQLFCNALNILYMFEVFKKVLFYS